jgi:hypothetical protein
VRALLGFRVFLRLVMTVCAISFGTNLTAACAEKQMFERVQELAKPAFLQGGFVANNGRRDLRSALGHFEPSTLQNELARHNLSAHASLLNEVVAGLLVIGHTGQGGSTSLTWFDVHKVELILAELCKSENGVDGLNEKSLPQRLLKKLSGTLNNWLGESVAQEGQSFSLLLFFFIFASLLTCLIVGVFKIYAVLFSFIANRKTCKIPAVVDIQGLEFHGHLSILGMRGSRFIPADAKCSGDLMATLKQQTKLPAVHIKIRGFSFEVKLHFATSSSLVTLFVDHLDRNTLSRLFRYSLTPIQFHPKTIIKSNMRTINPNFV